jgi:hypothetical protein
MFKKTMKTIYLLICFVYTSSFSFAQEKNDQDWEDSDHWSLYATFIGSGYTHWKSEYKLDNDFYILRGNGINIGPSLSLYYSFERLKLGINGSYQFFFINANEPENGFTTDIFDEGDNKRHIARLGGSLLFNIVKGDVIDILPCLTAGSFLLINDDFEEDLGKRFFASAGLIFEIKLGTTSLFAEPNYGIYKYRLESFSPYKNSYLHTFNGNLGLAFHF